MNAQAILDAARKIGLKLPPELLSAYYTALKTKGFVILTGVSGTGKTKLAQAFAELFGDEEEGACFVAVRPDWRDSRGLLGYWNPMEDVYESTPFLRALLRAVENYTGAQALTLEEHVKARLASEAARNWVAAYRRLAERVATTDPLHPSFPLDELWQQRFNGVADVSSAWRLPCEDAELRNLTTMLADKSKPVGERLVEVMQACARLGMAQRPWARTLRALAVLDTENATVLLGGSYLRAVLKHFQPDATLSLNYDITQRKGERITEAFIQLQNELRVLLNRIGQKGDNAILRSVTAWLVYEWVAGAGTSERRRGAAPFFIILDEMNLARVEHYFSDFLSVLESGRREDGLTTEPLHLHAHSKPVKDRDGNPIPPTLRLPPNIYVTGTVNVDETTYAFSPKVLDRAFTLEFGEVSFADYPPALDESQTAPPGVAALREEQAAYLAHDPLTDFTNGGKFLALTEYEKKQRIAEFLSQPSTLNPEPYKFRDYLENLKTLLTPHSLHFGYRVFDEIILFLSNAQSPVVVDGFGSLDAAFDCAVHAKVLPKFHGSRGKLEEPLVKVLLWCATPNDTDAVMQGCKDAMAALRKGETLKAQIVYPRTASKCQRMLREVYETGFASFA